MERKSAKPKSAQPIDASVNYFSIIDLSNSVRLTKSGILYDPMALSDHSWIAQNSSLMEEINQLSNCPDAGYETTESDTDNGNLLEDINQPFGPFAYLHGYCLVPLLARLPFMDQITAMPLTCHRWNTLLPRVLRDRKELVICKASTCKSSPGTECGQFQSSSSSSALYSEDISSLLFGTSSSQAKTPNYDHYHRNSLNDSLCRQIFSRLPNLTSLSLVNVAVSPESLTILLSAYQNQLEALYLSADLDFGSDEDYMREHGLVNRPGFFWLIKPDPSRVLNLYRCIDSLSSLRRLALFNLPRGLNLSQTLPTVLRQLSEFECTLSLGTRVHEVLSLFHCLDGSKLKRLALIRAHGSHSFTTAETLFDYIVANFTLLEYLDFTSFNPYYATLFPRLSKLKHLSALKVVQSSFKSAIPKCGYRLESLAVLHLNVEFEGSLTVELTSAYGQLFPNLRQLYLHLNRPVYEAQYPCLCQHMLPFCLWFGSFLDHPKSCPCKKTFIHSLKATFPRLEIQIQP